MELLVIEHFDDNLTLFIQDAWVHTITHLSSPLPVVPDLEILSPTLQQRNATVERVDKKSVIIICPKS